MQYDTNEEKNEIEVWEWERERNQTKIVRKQYSADGGNKRRSPGNINEFN